MAEREYLANETGCSEGTKENADACIASIESATAALDVQAVLVTKKICNMEWQKLACASLIFSTASLHHEIEGEQISHF